MGVALGQVKLLVLRRDGGVVAQGRAVGQAAKMAEAAPCGQVSGRVGVWTCISVVLGVICLVGVRACI